MNLTGGAGGADGSGGYGQGGGGGGGLGLYFSSGAAASLTITSTITGGSGGFGEGGGGVGGTAIASFNTSSESTTLTLGAGASATGGTGAASNGVGGYGVYGSNSHLLLDATSSVTGGLGGDGTTRAAAIKFADDTANVLELKGNGAASGTSYATITGNVLGAGGTGTTELVLGGQGGNFDLTKLGTTAQFQNFTDLTANSTGTWKVTGDLGTGAPTGWTIEAGKLEAASAGSLGTGTLTLKGAGTLKATESFTLTQAVALAQVSSTGGGTFEVDDAKTLTLSGVVSGAANLTKTGAGTLLLSGTNTFSGTSTVSAGELKISGGSSLSDTALLTVASGATLTLVDADETVGSLAGAGTVALNGYTLTTGGDNTSSTFSGILTGTGGLTKTGTGTQTLSGANTYSGTSTVSAGELVISGGSSLSDTALLTVASGATLTLADANETVGSLAGAGTVALNGYILTTGGDNTDTTFSGVMTGTGGLTKTGTGTQTLSGTNTFTGPTTVSDGELVIAGGSSLSDSARLTVATGATLTLSNADETVGSLAGGGTVALNSHILTAGGDNTSSTFSGVMTGTGGLTKTGTGTLILTGENTYTGTTVISAGILQIGDGGTTGSIAGDVLNNATLIFNRSDNITYDGDIGGTGELKFQGTGRVTLNGTISNNVLVEGGALDLRMGSVNPGTFTVQSGGVLGGTASVGNLIVNNGGTVAPGYSPGTLTVTGQVQFNAGSIYRVDATPAGAHDLIVAGGAVSLSPGAQVQVVTSPGDYPHLQRFVIVNTAGTLTGTFNSAVTTDLSYLSGYLSYDAQNVYLAVYDNRISFGDHAGTGNQAGVARAAQALGIGNSVFEAVLLLPFDGMASALNQLTGEAYASTQTVILDQSVYLREAVGARLGQAGSEGSGTSALSYAAKAAGPATAKLSADWTPTLWMQGYGGWGNAFSDGNAATISSSIGGFFVGLDAPVADHARVGLLGGFSRTNMDVTDRGSSGSIDNYDLGLYAGAKYGSVGLKAGVSYSWHDVSMERTIAFPGFWGATSAGYTQGTTQVFGEVNTSFAVSSYEFEPFVGLAYVHLSSASASEAAQTPAALAVDLSGMDTFYTTLGVRAATTVQVGGRTLTPSVTVGWQHAFNDVTPYSTMRFLDGAVPFGVEGVPVAENAAVLGAGLAYALSDKANLQVNYTGQIASSAANNAFTAQFALKF